MGMFDFLRRQQPSEAKESRVAATLVMNAGQARWTPREYDKLAREAYQMNVVAYQAVNKVADAMASVPWSVFSGDRELTDHPIKALLARPNPDMSYSTFMQAYVGYFLLSGNSYVERLVVGSQTRELYPLRSDRMKVVPDASGSVREYVYEVDGKKTIFPADEDTIRHVKLFNPLDDWYGMSPIEAAAYAVDQHNEAGKYMQALLQNSARPSGALKMKEGELSDENFHRLKAQIEEQYQGSQNAGRPMLLEGGLDWTEMGMSPTDMGLVEVKNTAARDICLAFGVPPQLLGIPGDNTYSNYQEARLAFWEDTVIPLLQMVAEDWSQWLGEGRVRLVPDLDQIPAIVDKRQKLWDMLEKSSTLTVNEKREAMGYERIEGGDVLLVPANQIPIADASMPITDLAAQKDIAYGKNA